VEGAVGAQSVPANIALWVTSSPTIVTSTLPPLAGDSLRDPQTILRHGAATNYFPRRFSGRNPSIGELERS